MRSRLIMAFLMGVILCSLIGCGRNDKQTYEPGTYETEAQGYGGVMKVNTTFDESKITQIVIKENSETEGIGSQAVDKLPGEMVKNNTTDVDGISGATYSSNAIKEAVKEAMNQAKEAYDSNNK